MSGARVLFLTLAGCWLAFFALFPELFFKAGINRFQQTVAPGRVAGVWFLDSYAILASNDAVSAGRDPYALNPLDYLERPHIYGPWWLRLRALGLTRADNFRVGLTLVAAFALTALSWLRPRDWRSALWYLAIFGSIPVLLALERANNDLVVFLVLTPVVPCLLSPRLVVRWLAVGFVAIAADLKFYPAVAALVLLAAAPKPELRGRILGSVALLALVGWHVYGALVRIIPVLPPAAGVFTFGAVGGFHEVGWHGPWPQSVVVGFGAVFVVTCWLTSPLGEWTPAPPQRREWLYFILGGALLTGCFFTGQNYAYRWIFALWLAPLLWTLPHDTTAPSTVRQLARTTRWLLLAVIWFDPACTFTLSQFSGLDLVRALHWVFLIEQPLAWALFGCLLVFLTHFTRMGLVALRGLEPETAA